MKDLQHSKERINQSVNFTGFKFDKIYPSDIDAVIEIDNEFLFLFEIKTGNNQPSSGQKYMLERIYKNWIEQGKIAYLIYCKHNTKSNEEIFLKDCIIKDVLPKDEDYLEMDVLSFFEMIAVKHQINKIIKSKEFKGIDNDYFDKQSFLDGLINV